MTLNKMKITIPPLVCLMVLITTIHSLSTPPATDPAIKIKFTTKLIDKVCEVLEMPVILEAFSTKYYHINTLYEGLGETSAGPIFELTPIANDRELGSHDGFGNVTSPRMKRDISGNIHAISTWQDAEFLAGKEIGGLQLKMKDWDFNISFMDRNGEYVEVRNTGITLKTQIFFGQHEGRLKLARMTMDVEGIQQVMANNEPFYLQSDKMSQNTQKVLDYYIFETKTFFNTYVGVFNNVLGSEKLPHIVFDFRLTEHPQFKEDGVEISMVGKFIYDEQDRLEYFNFDDLDFIFNFLKAHKRHDGGRVSEGDKERYKEKFVVYENEATPNITELMSQGNDEDEAERKDRGCIVLSVSQDVMNSLLDVLAKVLDLSFSKDMIPIILSWLDYDMDEDTLAYLPEGGHLNVKLNAIPDKQYVKYTDGGVEQKLSVGVEMAGLQADYFFYTKYKVMLRNGKIARDIQSLYLEKEADEGYPKLITEELLRSSVEYFVSEMDDDLYIAYGMSFLSEMSYHDGILTLGVNGDPFELMFALD